nr:hypothetical protein [uncultured Rhodopila sp.]
MTRASQTEIVTNTAHCPIKPAYIRRLLKFLDSVDSSGASAGCP